MDINVTSFGQAVLVLAIIVIFFTVRFARGKAENLPLVGFYATLLNLLLPPIGWIYCGYWYFKKKEGQ